MRSFWDSPLILAPRRSTSCAITGGTTQVGGSGNEASVESRSGGNRYRADVERMRSGGCRRWPASGGDAGRVSRQVEPGGDLGGEAHVQRPQQRSREARVRRHQDRSGSRGPTAGGLQDKRGRGGR